MSKKFSATVTPFQRSAAARVQHLRQLFRRGRRLSPDEQREFFRSWLDEAPWPRSSLVLGTHYRKRKENVLLWWLLDDTVLAIFLALTPTHHDVLQSFIHLFLEAAKSHTEMFTRPIKGWGHRFVNEHIAWAWLAPQIASAAIGLGYDVPEAMIPPPMPFLREPPKVPRLPPGIVIARRRPAKASRATSRPFSFLVWGEAGDEYHSYADPSLDLVLFRDGRRVRAHAKRVARICEAYVDNQASLVDTDDNLEWTDSYRWFVICVKLPCAVERWEPTEDVAAAIVAAVKKRATTKALDHDEYIHWFVTNCDITSSEGGITFDGSTQDYALDELEVRETIQGWFDAAAHPRES